MANVSAELGCFAGENGTASVECVYYNNWHQCRHLLLPAPPKDRLLKNINEYLWMVVPLIIVVFGLIGNILTMCVLVRSSKKMKSTALYLLFLAISDSVFLIQAPFRQWTRLYLQADMRALNVVFCKLGSFLTYTSYHFSTWLLVAVTMERMFSVLMPHKVRTTCTRRTSSIIILALFLTFCALNTFLIVGYTHVFVNGENRCETKLGWFYDFLTTEWPWIHFTVSFVAPFIFLLAGNIVIVRQLYLSRSGRKQMGVGDQNQSKSETNAITRVLTLLSTVFFVSQTPSIYFLYVPKMVTNARALPCDKYLEHTNTMDTVWLWYAITSLTSYTNATFNFLMYVLSGAKVRNELKALLMCQPPTSTEGAFASRSSTTRRVSSKKISVAIVRGDDGKHTNGQKVEMP